jgi:epoxyqueuosine reductase
MSLTQAIKAQAQALGFHLVGVTTPDPPPHLPIFIAWLEAGRHGEMGYLASENARQRRAEPRRILPECRSILVLGMRYPAPQEIALSAAPQASKQERPLGRIAAYAQGEDYHTVIGQRLEQLILFIRDQVGQPFPYRWYVDTGPVLERDLAQRAGLGWIGKNTCLIHPRLGSYLFLAEVFLGLQLDPDPPFIPDHCGTCTRCLEACPTACILPDRTLDARRCISYLTIELKGAIPHALRPLLGEWVFGCDVCQMVCPWNLRFAERSGSPPAQGRESRYPDLIQELSLTQEQFSRKFKGSAVKRAKRRGYLRNVAVALGNSRNPMGVPALEKALREDPEPLVRGHAAWALGRIGGEAARRALQAALRWETDACVLDEIRQAMAMADSTPEVRFE